MSDHDNSQNKTKKGSVVRLYTPVLLSVPEMEDICHRGGGGVSYFLQLYLYWRLFRSILHLLACQVELPKAIQISVVVSFVY